MAEFPPRLTVSEPQRPSAAILRLRPVTDGDLTILGRALKLDWPYQPNTSAELAGGRVFWLAPGEWALFDVGTAAVTAALGSVQADHLPHLSDVSGAWVRFRLDGAATRELLAKGCGLDLHPREFAAGECAQTRLADIYVLLHHAASPDRFDLYVDTSLAGHLAQWLTQAAQEFAHEGMNA
jgi:sarcosine oxidase subunit gamma